MKSELIVLRNLIQNEEYTTKVIPFLKTEYFSGADKVTFELIAAHVNKYKKLPSTDTLLIDLSKKSGIPEQAANDARDLINSLGATSEEENLEWLLNTTEEFCRDRAMLNAMSQAIDILQNKDKKHSREYAPELLREALSVSFDPKVGHDYLEDAAERWDRYNDKTARIPFDIDILNRITKGGLPIKTLSIIVAGTNVGKSLILCHNAASSLHMGKKVLYITLEMSEDEISKRIDANLLNLSLDDIEMIPREHYLNKIHQMILKTSGKLIIQEYPTGAASCAHFRSLLNDLALKKKFKPDIIYIDYLGICASSRISFSGDLYTYGKWVAEELRGLAIEYEVPVLTAAQFNRTGFKSSEPDLDSTAESFGVPMSADFMLGVVTSDELDRLGQFMFRQLKTRFGDKRKNKKFILGVDMAKQRLYEVEQSGQLASEEPAVVPVPAAQINREDKKAKFAKLKTS